MTNDIVDPPEVARLSAARARSRDRAWYGAGLAVAAVGWGANQFAPLLLMYRNTLGLSAATVEATFGLYAFGLIPGLLVGGPLSDRVGRRRVMLPALIASVLASLLLIAGGWAPGWLFAGRLVAGVASGAAFSSGAAWIKELSAAGAGGPHPGPRQATVAMTAGFGGGPLVAGVVAQFAPAHAVLPYVPHLVLTLLAVPLALATRETRPAQNRRDRRVVLWVPSARSHRFHAVVAPLAPWVFGSASVALAYLPGLVEDRLHGDAIVFAAAIATVTAVAGILVQPLARRFYRPGTSRLIGAAMAIVVAGLLVAAAAATLMWPWLVGIAAVVLGAGYGCCQVCGLLEVQRLAPAGELAGLTGLYQALTYVGFAVPYLLAATQQFVAPGVLLLIVAGLAGATWAWTVHQSSGQGSR